MQSKDTTAQPLQHLIGLHQVGDAVRLGNLAPHAAYGDPLPVGPGARSVICREWDYRTECRVLKLLKDPDCGRSATFWEPEDWWYGHVRRTENGEVLATIKGWTVDGRRPRGRLGNTGMDNVREDMRDLNIRDDTARDRERWRSAIARLTPLTGNNWRKRGSEVESLTRTVYESNYRMEELGADLNYHG